MDILMDKITGFRHTRIHIIEIKKLKPQITTVWSAMSAAQIFGPAFIKKNINEEISKPVVIRASSLF